MRCTTNAHPSCIFATLVAYPSTFVGLCSRRFLNGAFSALFASFGFFSPQPGSGRQRAQSGQKEGRVWKVQRGGAGLFVRSMGEQCRYHCAFALTVPFSFFFLFLFRTKAHVACVSTLQLRHDRNAHPTRCLVDLPVTQSCGGTAALLPRCCCCCGARCSASLPYRHPRHRRRAIPVPMLRAFQLPQQARCCSAGRISPLPRRTSCSAPRRRSWRTTNGAAAPPTAAPTATAATTSRIRHGDRRNLATACSYWAAADSLDEL